MINVNETEKFLKEAITHGYATAYELQKMPGCNDVVFSVIKFIPIDIEEITIIVQSTFDKTLSDLDVTSSHSMHFLEHLQSTLEGLQTLTHVISALINQNINKLYEEK